MSSEPDQLYLSIPDIQRRWSCSRTHVYRAIREMERGNYLKRIFLGKHSDQRIALTSVESWERLHSAPQDEPRAPLVRLRSLPRPKASTVKPVGGRSIRETWRRLERRKPGLALLGS